MTRSWRRLADSPFGPGVYSSEVGCTWISSLMVSYITGQAEGGSQKIEGSQIAGNKAGLGW